MEVCMQKCVWSRAIKLLGSVLKWNIEFLPEKLRLTNPFVEDIYSFCDKQDTQQWNISVTSSSTREKASDFFLKYKFFI